MSQSVLLTGATGFLGGYVLRGLLDRGHEVVAVTRYPDKLNRLRLKHPSLSVSFPSPSDIQHAFSSGDISCVIHAATTYKIGPTGAMLESNLVLPKLLFESAQNSGCPLFINCDTALPSGLNEYAASKHDFASFAEKNCGKTMTFINLKIQQFYGPGEQSERLVSWLFKELLSGSPSIPLTQGTQRRDFVYVTDVADAILLLVGKGGTFSKGFIQADLGSGQPVSIREFAMAAKAICRSKSHLDFGAVPLRRGEPMLSTSDSALLSSLGWSAKVGLEQGLKLTMEAIKKGWKSDA